ncbi:MAG: hypothetical protein AAB847_00740 [Patescibacteria group bacterium]
MKIGFDFDGVISDCGKLKSDGAKKLYGLDIPPHKFKREVIIEEGILTAEQYRNLQKIIYGTREIGFLMELVDGVLQYISKLLTENHTILIITSRGEVELEIAKKWSLKQGLKLNFVGVGYGKSKAGAAEGLDVYVDDDLDKLEPLIDVVPHRFLFSWGYNANVDTGKIARRVASWKELYDIIHKLEKGE